ncbi:MAG TPA: hypothetical protein VM715_18270 [Candidatus Acidoferrum sp.]|nr:hypothetical protein [Candidatus Acidoferrum sp.]
MATKKKVIRGPKSEAREDEAGSVEEVEQEEVAEEEVSEPEPEEEEYVPAEELMTDTGKTHLRMLVGKVMLVQGSVAVDVTDVVRQYSYQIGQLTLGVRHVSSVPQKAKKTSEESSNG